MTEHIQGFERYLRVLEGLKEVSVVVYVKKVREFLNWYDSRFQGDQVAEGGKVITRQDVEAFLEYCFYRKNVNQTRQTKLTALAKFARYLQYERILAEDFTLGIPKPRLQASRIHKFTKPEVLALFRTCSLSREKDLRDIVIFILAAFAGLRTAEICGVTMADVIDDGKDIDISVVGKFAKERKLYLWKAPGAYVRQYLIMRISQGARPSDPLLVSYKWNRPSGLPVVHAALSHMLHRRAKQAGVRKTRINMHMFRATHASDLRYIRGYDAAAIAQRLGHSNIATTDRYLPERNRIHRVYNNLNEYWIEFNKLWRDQDVNVSSNTDVLGGNIVAQG